MRFCKTFLLLAFLLILPACGTLTLEKSTSEIITLQGDKYRCEYIRGEKINCHKIIHEEVIEDENKTLSALYW